MRSEGVGLVQSTNSSIDTNSTSSNSKKNKKASLPGYEEVVVTAIPYNTSHPPVTAIALRAREHVRLEKDARPSIRYMNLLKEGAAELQLKDSYQQFLQQHPVQHVPTYLRKAAINNFIFLSAISANAFSGNPRRRWISKVQSWLLFRVYVRSIDAPVILYKISEIMSALILLPGAVIGVIYRFYMHITKKELSPMMQRFVTLLSATNTTSTLNQTSSAAQN